MCRFQVSVPIHSSAEARDAEFRLQSLGSAHVPIDISRKTDAVVAIIDHPTITCLLKMAGWVKDNFGMHPVFRPGVSMIE